MKILIKIGSALINKNHRINYELLDKKVEEMAQLKKKGHEFILVSSGAVAAGMEIESLKERPRDPLKLQILAGQGQIKLIEYYRKSFNKKGIKIAQILLTHHNFATPNEEKTIKQIISAYLEQGIIPVINENDIINKEELEYKREFTDNDLLAALVAIGSKVDLVIILTDVDGLYKNDPKKDRDAELVENVKIINMDIKKMATKEANSLGLGGMSSKIQASEMLIEKGIDTIIANGNYSLTDIFKNNVRRTFFKAG